MLWTMPFPLAIVRNVKMATFLRPFSSQVMSKRCIKVGDTLPDAILYENSPTNIVHVRDLFVGKKGVLFSVLGAYNPGCSNAHIPEYIHNYDQFKDAGYSALVCVSVNDPFVMEAWGRKVDPEGKIRMLADMKREFTKSIDMELNCKPLLGDVRSKRYSMLVEDNKIKHISMDPDHTGLACLLCIQRMSAQRINLDKKKTGQYS